MSAIMKPADFGKVAVMLGGRSAERAVSLKSGAMVLAALQSRGVDAHAFDPASRGLDELNKQGFQRVFIALHGRHGEDGTLQGALELLGIAYTGSGVLASALAMDKWRTKLIWQASGVSTPRYELLRAGMDFKGVVQRLGLPLMVKPASEGSSLGMSKVRVAADLEEAWTLAANYDPLVIAEQFIEGAEFTAGILGRDTLPLIAWRRRATSTTTRPSTWPMTRATSCPVDCRPRRRTPSVPKRCAPSMPSAAVPGAAPMSWWTARESPTSSRSTPLRA